jgi:hypothetical protein
MPSHLKIGLEIMQTILHFVAGFIDVACGISCPAMSWLAGGIIIWRLSVNGDGADAKVPVAELQSNGNPFSPFAKGLWLIFSITALFILHRRRKKYMRAQLLR